MANTWATYLRWRKGDPRESRVFPPLAPGNPGSDKTCPACEERIGSTKPVQLLAVGPDDSENLQKHKDGRYYSALAIIFHASCLGSEDEQQDREALELH